MMIDETHT